MVCGSLPPRTLTIDPDQRPRVDARPGDGDAPGRTRQAVSRRRADLPRRRRQQRSGDRASAGAWPSPPCCSSRKDLFLSAFVPGTGAFYDANALLFREHAETVRGRVDALLQLEPLYHAMAAAPDMGGFASLVTEIGKAVEQGRSPPGPRGDAAGRLGHHRRRSARASPRPLDWLALAGLDERDARPALVRAGHAAFRAWSPRPPPWRARPPPACRASAGCGRAARLPSRPASCVISWCRRCCRSCSARWYCCLPRSVPCARLWR